MLGLSDVWRSRWAAAGAAVAVTLGGGVMFRSAEATVGTGVRSVFVATAPCRLFDTRPAPDNVGPRTAPLTAGDTFDVAVRGAQGNCTIPDGAVGVVMNVTIDNPTAASYLTVYPGNVSRPLSSSLNWTADSSPTPNQVTVLLGAAGDVKIYNSAGSVDVVADVVGYFEDHNHDDAYYTKAQVDAMLASASDDVWALVVAGGGLNANSGNLTVTHPVTGLYCVVVSKRVSYRAAQATLAEPAGTKIVSVGVANGSSCPAVDSTHDGIPVYVTTPTNVAVDGSFTIVVPTP